MKKKITAAILCIAIGAAAAGCGGGETSGSETSAAATADNDARQSGLNENAPEPEVSELQSEQLSRTEGIDVDLTVLSSTMVYSEVYNMMADPYAYEGKTVRMKGAFGVIRDTQTGNQYYTCVIRDATACCAQGLEFVLAGDYTYPDDYPEIGDEVTVTGIFDDYMEGTSQYWNLRDAKFDA